MENDVYIAGFTAIGSIAVDRTIFCKYFQEIYRDFHLMRSRAIICCEWVRTREGMVN